MPDIPAYAFRKEVHLNPISQQQPIIEEISRLEDSQFVQAPHDESPTRTEAIGLLQGNWGLDDMARGEPMEFVQGNWGLDDMARTETVTFTQ